jgi:hypothetical protein
MTIERHSFRPPINVDEAGLADMDQLMLFAERTIVPPDYKLNITPPDYVDEYTLATRTKLGEIEDTVGELERIKGGRQKIDQPIKGFFNKRYETGGSGKISVKIDENTPIALIAKPNLSHDKKRFSSVDLGEIVRYTPAGKIVDEEEAKQALHREFVRILQTPVTVPIG